MMAVWMAAVMADLKGPQKVEMTVGLKAKLTVVMKGEKRVDSKELE